MLLFLIRWGVFSLVSELSAFLFCMEGEHSQALHRALCDLGRSSPQGHLPLRDP
jgi:hypothetical protein